MAFKELVSLDAETSITIGGVDKKTKKANPTETEGYYLGSRVVKGTRFGDSTLHFLQTEKGNLGVWGKTDMNRKLASVTPGTMIRIEYAGTVTTPNGDMHKYKVLVDNENTIDVGGLSAASTSGDEQDEDYDSSDASERYADSDEDEVEYEAPAPIAQASAAERKAKAQALLTRKAK